VFASARFAFAFAILLALVLASPAQAKMEKLQNFQDQPVPTKLDGSLFTLEEVQSAIARAAGARNWNVKVDGPSKLTASILVRGLHYAEVAIEYSPTTYSIVYVTSRELNYNEKKLTVHRSYNKWVRALNAQIAQFLYMRVSEK
jgi:hypothetical protein